MGAESAIPIAAERSPGVAGAGHSDVAVALVSSGEVAAIALAECNRRAAGLNPQNRSVRLARSEQAPAPPSAEKRGSGTVAQDAMAAGNAVSCATGDEQVDGRPARAALLSGRHRHRSPQASLPDRAESSSLVESAAWATEGQPDLIAADFCFDPPFAANRLSVRGAGRFARSRKLKVQAQDARLARERRPLPRSARRLNCRPVRGRSGRVIGDPSILGRWQSRASSRQEP
jgi:hypothetical protein